MVDKIIGLAVAATVAAGVGVAGLIKKSKERDEDGYNRKGYDVEGYDREGFNKRGFDREGYDRNGYNQDGYNRSGYDKYGFNRTGYNAEGYDRCGYNREGYNKSGFDKYGYDRCGFNKDGYDRGKQKKAYYRNCIKEINTQLSKAKRSMDNKELDHAATDIRKGMEKGMETLVMHNLGEYKLEDTLDKNITVCKNNIILEREFCEKLYKAKNNCNSLVHNNDDSMEFKHIYFAYKVLEELRDNVNEIAK